jgi:hypothetical protein
MALFVLQDVVGLEENTGTPAAVADGVHILLSVRYGMDQPRVCGDFEDVFGLFSCDLSA